VRFKEDDFMREEKLTEEVLRKELKSGMSIAKISKKYGISMCSIINRIRKYGLKQNYYRDLGKEWKKLCRNYNGKGRIVSLPSSILKILGFDITKDLEGRWEIENGRLYLNIREVGKQESKTDSKNRGEGSIDIEVEL